MKGLFGLLAAGVGRQTKGAIDAGALTWTEILGVPTSKTGAAVNVVTAMGVSSLFAAMRVLAEGIAQVPLKVYREDEDGALVAEKASKLYNLLYQRPNLWQTSFEFRETMMAHAILTGNGVAIKNVVGGELRELLPVQAKVRRQGWEVLYDAYDASGVIGTFTREQVFHLRGPSWDGFAGIDIIHAAREALGLAMATEESQARLHANGVKPGGLLSLDSSLTTEARDRIKAQIAERGGADNAFKTLILDKGATWTPFAMNGVDSQHVATRAMQIEEICRFLRVFPQMVGYADKTATFASAEAFFLAHVIHSLHPWVVRWEQALARDVMPADGSLTARFSLQGLMRGDAKSRAEMYASGIVNGWLTRNEARRFEDLNPIKGLDEPLVPLNMGTQSQRDAAAKSVAEVVKSMMGHNGGPSLSDDDADQLETKIARILSAGAAKTVAAPFEEIAAVRSLLSVPA